MAVRKWLITGTGSGIGLALSRECLDRGDVVIGVDRTMPSETPSGFYPLRADVSSEHDALKIARFVEARLGQLDVIVNNAAVMPDKDRRDIRLEDVSSVLDVNVKGTILVSEACAPLLSVGGSVICVTSSRALRERIGHFPDAHMYNLSKAFVNEYVTRLCLRLEGKAWVTAVDPGWVKTPMGGPNAVEEPQVVAKALYEHSLSDKRRNGRVHSLVPSSFYPE